MNNQVETTTAAQTEDGVLLKALKAAAKTGEGARAAEKKALDMLQAENYIATDLTSPKKDTSTCSADQWSKWRAVVLSAMTDTDKKLLSYANTDGLSKPQKARRKNRQQHIGKQIGWWSTSLANREKKALELVEGKPVKASYEVKLHAKLSTIVKQLEGREEFNGNLVALSNRIKDSLTHINIKKIKPSEPSH